MEQPKKRKPGRPRLPFPEPINRPMDEIASVVFKAPPKREGEWNYQREHRAKRNPRKASKQEDVSSGI